MSTPHLLVIKLGGEVVGGSSLAAIASDIAELRSRGFQLIIVHGGGPQTSDLQKRLGQKPVQIAGRRVTDEAALDALKMVVAGKLNVELCAALAAAEASPIGLHGASAFAIAAEKRPPRVYTGAGPDPIDLGLVGDVTGVNAGLFHLLLANGFVPVLACLGANSRGQVFNINADVVASRVASALGADGLFLISDVPGVLRNIADPGSRIPKITMSESASLVEQGVITKGMIVKLEEAFSAVRDGVSRVHIVGKLAANDLLKEALSPGSVGTVLSA